MHTRWILPRSVWRCLIWWCDWINGIFEVSMRVQVQKLIWAAQDFVTLDLRTRNDFKIGYKPPDTVNSSSVFYLSTLPVHIYRSYRREYRIVPDSLSLLREVQRFVYFRFRVLPALYGWKFAFSSTITKHNRVSRYISYVTPNHQRIPSSPLLVIHLHRGCLALTVAIFSTTSRTEPCDEPFNTIAE